MPINTYTPPNYQGVWDPNKTYTGTTSPTGTTKVADAVFYHGAYWIAGYNSVDINPAEDAGNDTPTVGVPYNGAGAWKIDTSTGAPAYNYDPSVPSAPTGLTQGYTSSSAISLFWNQAAVWGAGEVSSYNVYNNGALVGTTTSTNFTVTGLKASTTYNFTIDASDQFGTSGSQPVVSAYGTNENIHPGNNLTVSFSTHAPEALSGKFFSAYVDMSLPANPVNSAIPTSDILAVSKASGLRDFSLGFLQTTEDASHNVLLSGGMPTLSWGGLGTRNSLSTGTIINEIKAIQAEGGTITISIGGYNGQDPAVVAAARGMSAAQLQAEYQTAISTYGVDHLDFDIENALTVNNTAANALRDIAVKGLQAANPGLKVTYTMAVTPNGFDSSTTNGHSNTLAVLAGAKAAGVHIDVVNIMAMDYFDGDPTSESASGVGLNGMATKAISAANAAHNQLLALGINAKIQITPMPGQNDTEHEVFTLADAQAVETFAASTSWVAGLGEWSISRDNGSNGLQTGAAAHAASLTNGVGPVPGSAASSYYSSVVQSNYDFAKIFNAISVQAPGTPHVTTYSSVAGYTGANYDKVDAFATGVDKIDVSAVTSGGAVSINRGLDSSVVASKGASGASGVSLVHGVVQGFDMVLGANTTVYISGTDTGDSIYGSSGVDVISAGWGDDSIAGMAGADTLTGGLGADTLLLLHRQ